MQSRVGEGTQVNHISHRKLIEISKNRVKYVTLRRTSDSDPRPYRACVAMDGPFRGAILFGTPVRS